MFFIKKSHIKDVWKRPESSQFWILKVASFMISNSDSPGVKLTRSIFIFYDLTFWLLSLNSCGTHISDRIRNDRIKINDRRTAAFNKAFLHFRYKRLLWCLAEIFVLFLKQVIKHLINFLRNIFYRPIPKTHKFFILKFFLSLFLRNCCYCCSYCWSCCSYYWIGCG